MTPSMWIALTAVAAMVLIIIAPKRRKTVTQILDEAQARRADLPEDGSGAHYAPEGLNDPRWADVPLLRNSMLGNGWIEWFGPMSWDVRHDLTLPTPPPRARRAWQHQLGHQTVPFEEWRKTHGVAR